MLADVDLASALAVCAVDPVASVLATSRIEAAAREGLRRSGGQLWGYEADGQLVAVCWAGVNLVPVPRRHDGIDTGRRRHRHRHRHHSRNQQPDAR